MKHELNNRLYHGVLPKRKNTLLPGYDYSRTAFYHVILLTYKEQFLFGEYYHGCTILNTSGLKLADILMDNQGFWTTENRVFIPYFAVMPNHLHLMIHFQHIDNKYVLNDFISSLKLHITIKLSQFIKEYNLPRYEKHIWQSKYIERHIRDEHDYYDCVRYIQNNPNKWFFRRINDGIYENITGERENEINKRIEKVWEQITEGMETVSLSSLGTVLGKTSFPDNGEAM